MRFTLDRIFIGLSRFPVDALQGDEETRPRVEVFLRVFLTPSMSD
jgi:hypothetical protein